MSAFMAVIAASKWLLILVDNQHGWGTWGTRRTATLTTSLEKLGSGEPCKRLAPQRWQQKRRQPRQRNSPILIERLGLYRGSIRDQQGEKLKIWIFGLKKYVAPYGDSGGFDVT
jgi:hypothetical protein